MPGCCATDAYRRLFDEKNARREARRYLDKGLDPTARRMVDELTSRGVAHASVLEVGGGIGALAIELLRAGAARATNVELVDTYESTAHQLLETLGLTPRVDRTLLDFARDGGQVSSADIVLLHRVICCYPDMESLVRASAEHANRLLALSFPSDHWWWQLAKGLIGVWFRLQDCGFRIYLHDPSRILRAARSAGLQPILERRGWVWQIAVLERSVS